MMFDQALKINPNIARAFSYKGKIFKILFSGLALEKIGKFDEAIINYDYAL